MGVGHNMTSLADQFTDLQIDEMKEAFAMSDRNRDGTVLLSQLVTVFRTLGIHLTHSQIKVYLEDAVDEDSATIDFPEFLTLMSKIMNTSKSPACLLEAFRIFDKDDTGHILVSDLKIMMTKMGGETFSDEEFETMIQDVEEVD